VRADTVTPTLTPERLVFAPELAALDSLDHALHVALLVLIAAHPSLIDPDRPLGRGCVTKTHLLAHRILCRARNLPDLLRDYREAVDREIEDSLPNADDPF